MNDYEKNTAQKLAETLKRCGLASSVSQAHMMAGSITSTEKKVQNFFDQKKKEMKDDLMRNVHPHRGGEEHDMLSKAKETVAELLEKKEETIPIANPIEQASDVEAPKVEVYYEHHDEIIKKEEGPVKEEPKIMIIENENEDMLTNSQSLKDAVNEETRENEDYIDKYVNAKEAPVAEKEQTQEVPRIEPKTEEPKQALPPKPVFQPTAMGPHPKTGGAMSGISLHNYFNYGKRTK